MERGVVWASRTLGLGVVDVRELDGKDWARRGGLGLRIDGDGEWAWSGISGVVGCSEDGVIGLVEGGEIGLAL